MQRRVRIGLTPPFKRLNAALEAERAFAAESAHELRTPIAGALAQLQLASQNVSDPEASANLDQSVSALQELARLAENLLNISRIEAGFAISSTAHDIGPVLELVAKDFFGGEEDFLELNQDRALVHMSPDAFAIVARNLIANAKRYKTPGTKVSVTLNQSGLSVSNECDSIPQEHLEELKKRFDRGGRGEDGGTGLGLAIVENIAASIGGKLILESPRADRADGFSATFKFDGGGKE